MRWWPASGAEDAHPVHLAMLTTGMKKAPPERITISTNQLPKQANSHTQLLSQGLHTRPESIRIQRQMPMRHAAMQPYPLGRHLRIPFNRSPSRKVEG